VKCTKLAKVQIIKRHRFGSGLFGEGAFGSIRLDRGRVCIGAAIAALLFPIGCHRGRFPDVPAGYREFAYVSNGASNTVSVLDLVYMRQDRTLQVGNQPTGLAVNPKRNEVYVVNTGSASGNGSVSVIDTDANRVVATIPIHKLPYFIDVDAAGHRAYVANSGSNTVSVIDLDRRREIAVAGTGEKPGLARISPDMRTLVVTNRGSGSVSVFAVEPYAEDGTAIGDKLKAADPVPHLRAAFSGCPGATDAVILPYDSSKAFVACSDGHQVMAISLAAAPTSWAAKQDPSLLTDHMLALMDVGEKPLQLALKPDGGEIFVSNFGSGSFSEINTQTNEVGGTYPIGNKPAFGLVDASGSTLWVSIFGSNSINLWSIDDGKMLPYNVGTGRAPDALAFSADQHLLLAADAQSGDVTVVRTSDKNGNPTLFTILPAGGSPNAIAVKAMQIK
jgi:YVTN family beta-propeller protein